VVLKGGGTVVGREHLAGAPLDELPLSEKKQQFSLSFVHMVASAAGFYIKNHETDYDGVDVTIAASGDYAVRYCPQFEMQVKCTSQRNLLSPDTMAWKLKAGPFRRLTCPKSYLRRFLAVLLVPQEPSAWVSQDEKRLLTSSCMYWTLAKELGTIGERQKYKTVYLSRNNIFDVPQLQSIMKNIGDGDEW
jgi:hypothetical protein